MPYQVTSRPQAIAIALSSARRYCRGQTKGKCAREKIYLVMHEFKYGQLYSGFGKKVKGKGKGKGKAKKTKKQTRSIIYY